MGLLVTTLIQPQGNIVLPATIEVIHHCKTEESDFRLTLLAQSLLRARAKTTIKGAQTFIFAFLSGRLCLAEGKLPGLG